MVSTARKERKKKTEPAQPLHEYLSQRIFESGLSNVEMARALGYDKPNVIAMMKQGSMRLPVNKVAATARALGIDPVFLLDKVMRETSSDLWDALRDVMGTRLVTTNEMRLLEFIRGHLQGVDVDLTEQTELMDQLDHHLGAIFQREVERSKAMTELVRRHTKPGPRVAGERPALSSVKVVLND